MQHIALFGIGAIGSVIASVLEERYTVAYYNRSEKSVIKIVCGDQAFLKEISLAKADESAKPDWLIICLKEYHYSAALETLQKLITPSTKIAVIRNGLGLKVPLLPYTATDNILECMIDCPTQMAEEAHYLQLRKPIVTVAKGELASEFERLLVSEKVDVNQVDDYLTENWMKLIESSALGGLMVMHGKGVQLFKDPEMLQLYAKAIAEGIAVARADGAKISDDFKFELLAKLKTYPPTKASSMLIDRQRGNPIEIEAKNGIISHLGREHKVDTEVNDEITEWCLKWNKL